MSYQMEMTSMLSNARGIHEEHIYQFHNLVISMINDLVPPLIEQYWKDRVEQFTVDVITLLNGKKTDLTGLRADLQELILKELKNCSIKAK